VTDPNDKTSPPKPYSEQVKPGNFLVKVALARVIGFPTNLHLNPSFVLVAPYSRGPATEIEWVNKYDPKGPVYRVTADPMAVQDEWTLPAQTFADVIESHAYHPEAKSLGPDGQPCGRSTVGLLRRRHVVVTEVIHLGKEANELDKVQKGLFATSEEMQTTYELQTWEYLRTVLQDMPMARIVAETGYSKSHIYRMRAGQVHPGKDGLGKLRVCAARFAREGLVRIGKLSPQANDDYAVRLYIEALRD